MSRRRLVVSDIAKEFEILLREIIDSSSRFEDIFVEVTNGYDSFRIRLSRSFCISIDGDKCFRIFNNGEVLKLGFSCLYRVDGSKLYFRHLNTLRDNYELYFLMD